MPLPSERRLDAPARRVPALAFLAMLASLLALLPAAARAQAGSIEKIEVEGNEFISDEAFLALTDLEPGDAFDEKTLQTEFWKVWNSGLFEDVRIEQASGARGGHVVIFVVREKPRIDSVTFEQVKAVSRTRIDEVLKDNDAQITPNTTFDQERVSKTKRLLEELMASEGYPDARVTVHQRRVARSRVALDFKLDPGARIKIDEIDFTGNSIFSDKQLKEALKRTKESGLFSKLSSKSVFYRPRFQEDLQGVRDLYRSKGYIDAEIGEPVLRDAGPGKSGKEERRFVRLEVPVKEGRQYRLGKLSITGNTVFGAEELRPLIPLAPGEVLNDQLLKLGLNRIDNRYGDQGYLYASSAPRYDKQGDQAVAAVDIQITEGSPYTIRRIEFDGNVRTRDEVLRREMRITEGKLFSRRDFLISSRKIAQLGFFELEGEPTITPVPGTTEADIRVKGKEIGRNEIQFGGGYSGVDGFFATFSFFSRNFLGRGSALSVTGQLGGETTRYSLSYVEPYFMRTKSSLGGSVFSRDQTFTDFERKGRGGSIFWSYPTSTFSYFRSTASYENSKITGRRTTTNDDEYTTYSLTPSFTFDNRDNPLRPTRGRRFNVDLEVGASTDEDPDYGPPFDDVGTVNYLKPGAGFTQYFRTRKKQYVGIHGEVGLLTPFSGTKRDQLPEDGIDAPYLPVFERFFLGGERSIRGVETRSVGPRVRQYRAHSIFVDCNEDGDFVVDPMNPAVADPGESPGQYCPGFDDRDLRDEVSIGGDVYWLLNFEYSIPFSSIFEATAFVDVGNSFGVNHVDLGDVLGLLDGDRVVVTDSDPFDARATAGVELRFHTPVLQQPLRLIYGCKVFGDFDDDRGSCDFQFSIGRTFQ